MSIVGAEPFIRKQWVQCTINRGEAAQEGKRFICSARTTSRMFLGVVERDTRLAFCALLRNTTKLALNESTQQLQLVLGNRMLWIVGKSEYAP